MADRRPDNDDTPRWVKVSGIIGGILALLFVILVLTGHGPGRHISRDNTPTKSNQ